MAKHVQRLWTRARALAVGDFASVATRLYLQLSSALIIYFDVFFTNNGLLWVLCSTSRVASLPPGASALAVADPPLLYPVVVARLRIMKTLSSFANDAGISCDVSLCGWFLCSAHTWHALCRGRQHAHWRKQASQRHRHYGACCTQKHNSQQACEVPLWCVCSPARHDTA